jgi:hypothetical protein
MLLNTEFLYKQDSRSTNDLEVQNCFDTFEKRKTDIPGTNQDAIV